MGAGTEVNLANLAKMANMSGTRRGAIFASVLSIGGERPEPATMGNAFFRDGDPLGFACRIERLLAKAMGGGVLTQLTGGTRSVGEGLPQPGAGLVDDGAPSDASIRRVPLRLEELGGRPGTLPLPFSARR
jgi:hypothetical protein